MGVAWQDLAAWLGPWRLQSFLEPEQAVFPGWVIWTSAPEFKIVWGGIAALSTLLAAIKPTLQMDRRLRRYSTLFSGYRGTVIVYGQRSE